MVKLARREFIKIASCGAAAAAVPVHWMAEMASAAQPADLIEKVPTVCDICFWQCAGWAYLKNGKPWKIIGNDEDLHSRGRLCTRGTGGWGAYLDPDRLRKPLIRVSERGTQGFKEASWDEALSYCAAKLADIKDKFGPEAVALFSHGSGGVFFKKLLQAYGSKNISAPSYAQCRGPRDTAFVSTFGESLDSPECTDIANAKCLVVIGGHIGENLHNNQVSELGDAINSGATIIAVDPRFSVIASKAKYYLPIKPATDTALLLAWINVLLEERLYDAKFVESYCHGFEELTAHIKPFTPEWAAPITTLDAALIRTCAREMAQAAPATLIHPGRHVTWYGDDTQRSRAIAILNALLGSWWRPGGFYKPEAAELPDMPIPEFPKPAWSWHDLLEGRYPLALSALASDLCDQSIPGDKEARIKAWVVYSTNLIKTLPNIANTVKALQALEFSVVIDTMPMEITGWADVVLPECTYLERYDLIRTSAHRAPSLALRMPALPPAYDSKPGWWICKELAGKMGLADYFPWQTLDQLLDWQLKQRGSSLDELTKVGVKNLPRTTELYPLAAEDAAVQFNTPTEQIELLSTKFKEAGFEEFPSFTPHEEPPSGFYRLLYGRAPAHTFSRTTNNPALCQLMPENELWVNSEIAGRSGLINGQRVILENQDGARSSSAIKVRVTERIRPDAVYMVHGFGHTDSRLKLGYKKGACDQELVTKVLYDPLMGGTGMRGNFVRFIVEA